ncbi:tubulin-tyrosine ligase family-domain-containing protein [Pelagophyceae sp. CCMP2097]|nr:tubulin-tyrosine ligase family-domain-containing protein [Pelagophyceae sp. CCMP2097]
MALRHRDAMSPTLAAPFVPQEGDGKKPRRLMVPVWALLVAAAGGYLWASHRPQSTFDAAAPQRAAASVPASARRKFFARPAAAKFGAALVKRGWEAVNDPDKAEILWYQQKSSIDWKAVQPWQRVNHVFRETEIGHKGHLLEHLRGTPAERYLPETYTLNVAAERAAFERLVVSEGAPDSSKPPRWILKEPNVDGGKGIHVLADARAALDADKLKPEHFAKIAQRYVGNLLLFEGRKFDVRCYWVVERLKPNPRVLFHPGTLRVSLEDYNGGASGNKALHLTNAAQQKGGHSESHEAARQPMSALWAQLRNEPRAGWPADTAKHLECQMRRPEPAIHGVRPGRGGSVSLSRAGVSPFRGPELWAETSTPAQSLP